MLDREAQKGTGGRFSHRAPARTPRPVVDTALAVSTIEDFRASGAEIASAVRDAAAAAVLSRELGMEIPANAPRGALTDQEVLLVGLLVTDDRQPLRLPAGATTLPEGAAIEWWIV